MHCCVQSAGFLFSWIILARTIAAGPSSPTLSLPAALADSGQYGAASAQQAASSLPASSLPGSTASPYRSYGALAPPVSGSRRPYRSDISQGYTPQRGRRLSLPGNSGFTVSNDQVVWGGQLITAYLRRPWVMPGC